MRVSLQKIYREGSFGCVKWITKSKEWTQNRITISIKRYDGIGYHSIPRYGHNFASCIIIRTRIKSLFSKSQVYSDKNSKYQHRLG